jgi:hypothetical protein
VSVFDVVSVEESQRDSPKRKITRERGRERGRERETMDGLHEDYPKVHGMNMTDGLMSGVGSGAVGNTRWSM